MAPNQVWPNWESLLEPGLDDTTLDIAFDYTNFPDAIASNVLEDIQDWAQNLAHPEVSSDDSQGQSVVETSNLELICYGMVSCHPYQRHHTKDILR